MDTNVSLVPGKDYTLGAALVTTLGGVRDLNPQVLKHSWHEHSFQYAVDYLVATVCWGHDPVGHADCKTEWESWPNTDWTLLETDPQALEDTVYYRFYCHDAANQCGMCGHQWKGLSKALKADAALAIKKGDVLVNRCPQCLAIYDIRKGQRLRWREMVAGIIGQEVAQLDKLTRTVRTDMLFRLARFMARGAMAAGSTSLVEADILKSSLLHAFAGMSIRDSTIYDAASWYARGPFALPCLGYDDMEKLEDSMTRNEMRTIVPLVNDVYERLVKGESVPNLVGIMQQDGEPLKERVDAARALLKELEAPPAPEDPEAPQGILLEFADGSRFLVENWNGQAEREAEHRAGGGRILVLDASFAAVAQWLAALFGSQA